MVMCLYQSSDAWLANRKEKGTAEEHVVFPQPVSVSHNLSLRSLHIISVRISLGILNFQISEKVTRNLKLTRHVPFKPIIIEG